MLAGRCAVKGGCALPGLGQIIYRRLWLKGWLVSRAPKLASVHNTLFPPRRISVSEDSGAPPPRARHGTSGRCGGHGVNWLRHPGPLCHECNDHATPIGVLYVGVCLCGSACVCVTNTVCLLLGDASRSRATFSAFPAPHLRCGRSRAAGFEAPVGVRTVMSAPHSS